MEKLNGEDVGDLGYLKCKESMAGNAGNWQGLPCIAANFYCDQKNGMIVYFGNWQNVPKSIQDRFKQATLRIAVDLKTGIEKIVDVFNYNGITDRARQNLEETARTFNKKRLKQVAA